MKRFKHSLSHYKLSTLDMGKLVPVCLLEAIPGDTFQQSTSMLMRVSPLVAPVMHPVNVRIHHWFVPHRLVYPDFPDLITGGPDGTGPQNPMPSNSGTLTPDAGELLDHFGVPPGVTYADGQISLMPVRSYNLIYNEFYRDQDLVSEVDEDSLDLQRVSWEKDYFTTSRPWTQKGPAVTLPIGDSAPIQRKSGSPDAANLIGPNGTVQVGSSAGGGNYNISASSGSIASSDPLYHSIDDLAAAMETDLTGAAAASIVDFRRAFALQRYQEARAQYGSRYTEYLRYLGVRPSDARLQRPEYLGGAKQTIAFSEVLRTGSGDTAEEAIGSMKGHGIAALRSNRYRYFVQEHGYIISLLSVRPRTMYTHGIDRLWSRRLKEDYWQRELELIGQQEVLNQELFVDGSSTDDLTFGYQDRYAEYRHQRSMVTGEFRDTLNYWHMGREFASLPTLNQSFIDCEPTKRIHAVQTNDVLWAMVSHSIQCRRPVTKKTVGRII